MLASMYRPEDATILIPAATPTPVAPSHHTPIETKVEEIEPMKITTDKTGLVLEAKREEGEPVRQWRFQRRPEAPPANYNFYGKNPNGLRSEEAVQSMLAMYVDQPRLSVKDVAQAFGVTDTTIHRYLRLYGITSRMPQRNPHKPKAPPFSYEKAEVETRTEKPTTTLSQMLKPEIQQVPPAIVKVRTATQRWRVTVIREIVEEIEADDLLGIAAHFDGTGVEVVRVEKCR